MDGGHDRTDAATLLARVAAGRGYLLPHHRLLAAHAPRALAAYDALYRALTLEAGALDPADRERVWMALLAVRRKFSWRIHLRRAREAGLDDPDVADCLALAAFAAGSDAFEHAQREWSTEMPADALEAARRRAFESARGRMAPGIAHAVVAVCHAARSDADGLRRHVPAALRAGVPPAALAEALAYTMLECGANALIEAVDAWSAAAAAGECVAPFTA